MTVVNWSKLAVSITTIICVTALLMTNHLTDAVGIPVITTVLGYMLGNGVAARANEPVQPVFYRRNNQDQ